METVYISNLSEDVWPFICSLKHQGSFQAEIKENKTVFSNRDLLAFSGQDNVTLILPTKIDPDFASYYLNLFRHKNFHILATKKHSGEICRDILNDKNLLQTIRQLKTINLISYSTTPQLLELVGELRKYGVAVQTPESPEADAAWTVNFYGSKSGIRQLGLKMPMGQIVWGINEAAKIAVKTYQTEGGVVLKTNKGHAGMGMLIFRPGDLSKNLIECQAKIYRRLKTEAYWNKFPLVIEKYIEPNLSVAGGFPNAEFKIDANGKVVLLYFCGMRVVGDGIFRGIEIYREVMSAGLKKQIRKIGNFVGKQYSSMGYRGYFELDFVAGKDGEIYVTESNVRRTGGTHVYYTAMALFGENFINQVYTLSSDNYKFKNPVTPTFKEFKERLQPILFNRKIGEGVIITSATSLSQNIFGYIIFGKTKARALLIEQKMIKLIN